MALNQSHQLCQPCQLEPLVSPRTTRLAVGALLLNALIWGVSWWPFRQLERYGLHPLWATALMYGLISTGILLFYTYTKAWHHFRGCLPLCWLGVAAGLTNVGFNWAVTVGDVVRVVLLFYLMPAWSVLVAWWMLGEKPTAASLLRLGLAMMGVLVVLKTPDSPWPIPQNSIDWLAMGGGLSFAITNVLLRQHGHLPNGARMLAMFGGSGLMAVGAALAGMWLQSIPSPTLQTAGLPVFIGLSLAFVASNVGLQYGAAKLSASTTAIVMLTEILFASASSVAMGAAEFTPRIVLGGSLIVLAALLAALAHSGS